MSKRHAASRRRTYGRRQHELHERMDRRAERGRVDRPAGAGPGLDLEPQSYVAAPANEPPYGFAD